MYARIIEKKLLIPLSIYFLPEFSRIFHLDGASIANEMAVPFEELYPFLRMQG